LIDADIVRDKKDVKTKFLERVKKKETIDKTLKNVLNTTCFPLLYSSLISNIIEVYFMEDLSFHIENFSKKIGKLQEELKEQYPNLKPQDFPMLMYVFLGYIVGKGFYAHLEFTLENDTHIKDLEALSNGYIEFDGKVLKMGVTKVENFEKILQTSYIKPKSIHILKR